VTNERDERWAYIVLAVLVFAYVAYRFWPESGSEGLAGIEALKDVSVRLPEIDLGKLGKSLPYLAAPLFAVLSEMFRRRKAKAVREAWERNAQIEGFVRGEDNVKIRFVEGGRGTIQGDLRMTRAALYLLDRSGRRDPMRFAFARSEAEEPIVLDATVREGTATESRRVRITIGESADGNSFAVEFESKTGQAWRSSILRALGKRADGPPSREEPPEPVKD
jgi:hypothetical protein